MLGPVAIAYGIASAAAFGFAALSTSERPCKMTVAATILAGWAVSNATNNADQDVIWPIMDTLIAMSIALAWIDWPTAWKARLFVLFIMQSLCHVAYHTALVFGLGVGYGYTAALNALFVCQLWVVSSDGVKRGRDYLRDWFAGFHGRTRHHGIGPSHGAA